MKRESLYCVTHTDRPFKEHRDEGTTTVPTLRVCDKGAAGLLWQAGKMVA